MVKYGCNEQLGKYADKRLSIEIKSYEGNRKYVIYAHVRATLRASVMYEVVQYCTTRRYSSLLIKGQARCTTYWCLYIWIAR